MASVKSPGKPKPKTKNFSSFSLDQALAEAQIDSLLPWALDATTIAPSDFFYQVLDRLKQFDTRRNERGRELIIDAVFAEAISHFKRLKIWKGSPLVVSYFAGEVDYLLTRNRDAYGAPYLCAVEAKKDDFEKGLAQCLVEMKACWLKNQEMGQEIEVFGMVTNGVGWKFYRWVTLGKVYETVLYGENSLPLLFGALHQVLGLCDRYLDVSQESIDLSEAGK
jgi:hypothetical protein